MLSGAFTAQTLSCSRPPCPMSVLAFLNSGVGRLVGRLVGGYGTSRSRLITANEQTPWRMCSCSPLPLVQFAIDIIAECGWCCIAYSREYNMRGGAFGAAAFLLSLRTPLPLIRTMFTLRRPVMLHFNMKENFCLQIRI